MLISLISLRNYDFKVLIAKVEEHSLATLSVSKVEAEVLITNFISNGLFPSIVSLNND